MTLRLGSEPQTITIAGPPSTLTAGKPLDIEFQIPDAISPKSLGISEDERLVGLGLQSLRVTTLRTRRSPEASGTSKRTTGYFAGGCFCELLFLGTMTRNDPGRER